MHVVYKVNFINREKLNIKPFWYIGSKSNCVYNDKEIIDKNGRPYWGSSTDKTFQLIKQNEHMEVEILFQSENYKEVQAKEREIQEQNDVVADPRYFNKMLAQENNYHNPNYATYKHVETGKIARLPRDHPKVLDCTWVGVTKGISPNLTEEQRKKRSENSKRNNELRKLKYSESDFKIWNQRAIASRKQRLIDDPDYAIMVREHQQQQAKKIFSGRKWSEDHKINQHNANGVRGKTTIISLSTLEKKVVLKEEVNWYKEQGYVTFQYYRHHIKKSVSKILCQHCNKEFDNRNFKRWHGDNCKARNSNEED